MKVLRSFLDDELRHFIAGRSDFAPFPRGDQRAVWEQLPADITEPILAGAEPSRDVSFPPLPATLYMDYSRTGNRERYQNVYFQRREIIGRLVVAECIQGRGRFLDPIVDGIWSVLEESSWVIPAHNDQRPRSDSTVLVIPDVRNRYIDLFAAGTGALLAWSLYLLGDALRDISPLIPQRIEDELRSRIIEPYLGHDDFWWMGFGKDDAGRVNNWNPWCNSNCLAVSLLVDTDDSRRVALVEKACRSIDVFIESYGVDGGCDEGPSYWGRAGASLFDCLELLFLATGGRIDLYDDQRIQNIGRYIYRAHLSGPFYVNFADCAPKVSPPSDLIYRYGKRIGDQGLKLFGAALFADADADAGRDLFRYLHAIFDAEELSQTVGNAVLPRSSWFFDTEVAVVREKAGSEEGFAVAAKGGHNAESHNHNDIGQVIIFYDGVPVLIDPGVQTYTAATFSERRYDIWTMQSAYHNLPTIGGAMQRPGRSATARGTKMADDGSIATFTTEISGAYPESAGISRFDRSVALYRGEHKVAIVDSFDCAGETEIEWSFMLHSRPEVLARDVRGSEDDPAEDITMVRLSDALTLSASGGPLDARVDEIAIDDSRLKPQWGDKLFRLVLGTRAVGGTVTFEMSPTGGGH